jgi:hypothetical protein
MKLIPFTLLILTAVPEIPSSVCKAYVALSFLRLVARYGFIFLLIIAFIHA